MKTRDIVMAVFLAALLGSLHLVATPFVKIARFKAECVAKHVSGGGARRPDGGACYTYILKGLN